MTHSLMSRLLLGAALLAAAPVAAQTAPPPAPGTTAPRPGTTVTPMPPGITALRGQTPEQAQIDVSQCQNAATQVSGYIPGAQTAAAPTSPQGPQGARVKGAAVGAATGAVVGGVQNNQHPYAPQGMRDDHVGDQAVTGAAAGAVVGGSKSRQNRRQSTAEQKKAVEEQEKKQTAWLNNYSACLSQRGYSQQ